MLPPGTSVNFLAAGSTHMLVVLSDGSVQVCSGGWLVGWLAVWLNTGWVGQVVGENPENVLCSGHYGRLDKAYPPIFVNLPNGERFKVARGLCVHLCVFVFVFCF